MVMCAPASFTDSTQETMYAPSYSAESLFEIIWNTAVEELGISYAVAADFAQIAVSKVTGFFLRFDSVPRQLILKNVRFEDNRFIAVWESVSKQACCPLCGKTSEKEHSSLLYSEMVQDICINGTAFWHEIHRKQYMCMNDHCTHKRFLESFPGFIEARYARMTTDFVEHILKTAVNTSNNAAAKILKAQGAEISRDTIIRVTLRRGAKEVERNFYDNADEVINMGIDDINLRKGDSSTSCMVFVNLDTGKLLGIARGTTGATAQQVLSMFPNLEIVSRDRGCAMASAANALGKTSVADRFHLTDNMHDAIERTLYDMLPKSMYIPVGDSWVCLSTNADNGEVVVAGIPAALTENDVVLRVRMAHLSAKAELTYRNTLRVLELTVQGKAAVEIAEVMGITADEVRKLRSGMRETISSVERKIDEYVADPQGSVKLQKSVSRSAQHSSKSKVEPYRDIVVAMRKEGKSHIPIYEHICKLGFEGSHSTVDNYIIKLERESSIDAEIKAERIATGDYFAPMPERPERISVSVYSVKTIYNMALAKIREHRDLIAGGKLDTETAIEPSSGIVKKTPYLQVTG